MRQLVQNVVQFVELVMFEVAREWSFDPKVFEQFPRMPCVLRCNETRFAQYTDRPRGDVFEIADGGGDEKERTHAMIVSPLIFQRR